HYSVRHLVGTILRSRHFYSRAAYRKLVKSPVEFSAGLVRTLGLPRGRVNLPALAQACKEQGQDLFYPPSVKGWDTGRAWITSATLLARSNWVADVVWGNDDLDVKPYDPAPRQTARTLLELLLQDDLSTEARALIRGASDDLRKALQLILHCLEYQLA